MLHDDGLLSADQMSAITSFCYGILGRTPVLDEVELQEVARGMLTATGQLRETDRAVALDAALGRVSAFARALTPEDHELTAQPALLRPQVELLRDIRSELLRDNVVLPLLPPLQPCVEARHGQAQRLLWDARQELRAEGRTDPQAR